MSRPPVTLIGISGKQFAGKDLLADCLLEAMPEFQKMPLALAIKQAYGEKTGLSLEEIESHKAHHRAELIALGNWGRAQDPDYWLNKVFASPGQKIISDVRLQREYEMLRNKGAFLIRVEADRAVRTKRGQLTEEMDKTECDLDAIQDWDAVLENKTTKEEFKHQAHKLVTQIQKVND